MKYLIFDRRAWRLPFVMLWNLARYGVCRVELPPDYVPTAIHPTACLTCPNHPNNVRRPPGVRLH